MSGYKCVWALTCVGHKRVWAQLCGHNHVWAQTWWNQENNIIQKLTWIPAATIYLSVFKI